MVCLHAGPEAWLVPVERGSAVGAGGWGGKGGSGSHVASLAQGSRRSLCSLPALRSPCVPSLPCVPTAPASAQLHQRDRVSQVPRTKVLLFGGRFVRFLTPQISLRGGGKGLQGSILLLRAPFTLYFLLLPAQRPTHKSTFMGHSPTPPRAKNPIGSFSLLHFLSFHTG